jgi:uncharacterized damage-inducible protein DinB
MNDYSETIRKLVEYEIWCNLQAIDFLTGLSEDESRHDFGFGLRTPHRTMSHIVEVMRGWSGCVGPIIKRPTWFPHNETITLQQIRRKIVEAGESWMLAVKLSEEEGLLGQDQRLNQVFHLVTHGTHHRGQLLSMITLMGYDQPFEGGDFGGWSNNSSHRGVQR